MTAEQFAYWMQGFAELNAEPPTAEQWKSIREHLATVYEGDTALPAATHDADGADISPSADGRHMLKHKAHT